MIYMRVFWYVYPEGAARFALLVPELMRGLKYESLLLLERCRGDLCKYVNVVLS
jgi:hypothetical protein